MPLGMNMDIGNDKVHASFTIAMPDKEVSLALELRKEERIGAAGRLHFLDLQTTRAQVCSQHSLDAHSERAYHKDEMP